MYIYKTTNLITNEFYIGLSTKHNPNYSGSGELLKQQVAQYGEENFRTSRIADLMVDFAPTEEENKRALEKLESMCIQMHYNNPLCINLSKGSYKEGTVVKEKVVVKYKYVKEENSTNESTSFSISKAISRLFNFKSNNTVSRNNEIEVSDDDLNKNYHSVSEVAKMFGTKPRAIQRRCVRANLDMVKGKYVIPTEVLNDWITKLSKTKRFESGTMMPITEVSYLTGVHYRKIQRRAKKLGVKKVGREYMVDSSWVIDNFPDAIIMVDNLLIRENSN